jgi:hypothetical protein
MLRQRHRRSQQGCRWQPHRYQRAGEGRSSWEEDGMAASRPPPPTPPPPLTRHHRPAGLLLQPRPQQARIVQKHAAYISARGGGGVAAKQAVACNEEGRSVSRGHGSTRFSGSSCSGSGLGCTAFTHLRRPAPPLQPAAAGGPAGPAPSPRPGPAGRRRHQTGRCPEERI